MIEKIVLALAAFLFSGDVLLMPRSPMQNDLSSKLNRKVTNYNLGVFDLVNGLLRVSSDLQIPMGIEWVDSPSARAVMPFAWKDATVREIIESIAKTQPGYTVVVKNGVVHISISNEVVPAQENYLNQSIETFQVQNAYLEVASFKLHALVTPIEGNRQISIAGPGDSRVSVDLKNCTLEDALDALVVASNRKVWVLTLSTEPTLTPSGHRKTRSLFTDAPIKDNEQPVWYLHRWGDPLPAVAAHDQKLAPREAGGPGIAVTPRG